MSALFLHLPGDPLLSASVAFERFLCVVVSLVLRFRLLAIMWCARIQRERT